MLKIKLEIKSLRTVSSSITDDSFPSSKSGVVLNTFSLIIWAAICGASSPLPLPQCLLSLSPFLSSIQRNWVGSQEATSSLQTLGALRRDRGWHLQANHLLDQRAFSSLSFCGQKGKGENPPLFPSTGG